MKLVDITKENRIQVLFLTTNQKVTVQGSGEPYDAGRMPTLCEDFVASNELCRIMIDRKHQGKGYGTQAIRLVLDEMSAMEGCREVYLSTDPENTVGKHVYEKIGFVSENQMIDDEELYKYVF